MHERQNVVPNSHHDNHATRNAVDVCGSLLVNIQCSNTGAFEELFNAYSRILMATIVRIVKNRALAEEVLQECFVEVWIGCHGFDPQRGSGRAWLITMCRRRAIDCLRSVQAQQNRDYTDGMRAAAGQGEQVKPTVIEKLESELTATALKLLPKDQAEPIAMAFYQGLTHVQIAEELETPLGTIKSRIKDGMKRLRDELEGSR